MRTLSLSFVLLGVLLLAIAYANAEPEPAPEPEPEPAKGRRTVESVSPKFRAGLDDVELRQMQAGGELQAGGANKTDASSGRLFLKKFLLFRNMFGSNQQQPIIPIIVTGGSSPATTGGTYTTSPATSPTTATYTSTGTVPTASGTITTTPATTSRLVRSGSNYGGNADDAVDGMAGEEDDEENPEEAAGEAAFVDEQTLQAALAAGAQEYIVTDEELKGTSDSKASKQPARIHLRRKGANKKISVRIPPKYRRYFKNGQKVMLNTGKRRTTKRRVVKKRGNKIRRRRFNKNGKKKRTRVVAA